MPNLTHRNPLPEETHRPQEDYILLDSSGSMSGAKWDSSVAAIDAYVNELRTARLTDHITLDIFSGPSQLGNIERDCSLHDWVSLHSKPPRAFWGGTALYDAIALMCFTLRDRDPQNCVITIYTDGHEADSATTTLAQARALLDWCRAKGWGVRFIGCDFANHKQAALLGARPEHAIGVQRALMSEATRSLAQKRARNILTGASMDWSEDEQQQFGGYLAPPKRDDAA